MIAGVNPERPASGTLAGERAREATCIDRSPVGERARELAYIDRSPSLGGQPARAPDLIAAADLIQWCACLLAACSFHGVAMFLALHCAAEPLAEGDSRVVMLELVPVAASPPDPPSELAPGPERTEVQAAGALAAAAGSQADQTEPMKEDAIDETDPILVPAPEKQSAAPSSDSASDDVIVATAPPRIETPAATAAGPAPGETDRNLATTMRRWQQALVAHLQRHKRYPPHGRGASGTASVAFSIDRNGRILSSRIVRSSGSAALDDETLALVTRAQPFPPPPENAPADLLSFVVPVRYRRAAEGSR